MPVKKIQLSERARKEREKEEEEEERRGWSRCGVCEEEYSEDVRVLPGCLHSFCYPCLLHSSATSSLCPLCHTPITSPLPSLPRNYSLLTWLSLSQQSPSLISHEDEDGGDDGGAALLPLNGDDVVDEEDAPTEKEGEGECEGCEEGGKEVYCEECDRHYCTACSSLLHSLKINRSHALSPPCPRRSLPSSPVFPRSSLLSLSSSQSSPGRGDLQCEGCGVHEGQEKRLYCVICNEFVCAICIDDHSDHKIISVFKYIELVKERWRGNLQQEMEQMEQQFQAEGKIASKLTELNEEIAKLHSKLEALERRKTTYQTLIDDLHLLKLHFDLSNRFLLSFLRSLPPLPLSSFYSPPLSLPSPSIPSLHPHPHPHPHLQQGGHVVGEGEGKGRRRIKEFFERENIQRVYRSFLPLADSSSMLSSAAVSSSLISAEEMEKRREWIRNNELLQDENLLLSFGSKTIGGGGGGGNAGQFASPYFLSINLSKGTIAVSDYAKKRVQVCDAKGNHRYQLLLPPPAPGPASPLHTNPWGVCILAKANQLAVVDHSNHQIQLVDLQSGEIKSRIGKGMGKEIGQFTNPRGIAYCSAMDLLAVCDQNNHRIQLFSLSTGEFHSAIPLTFQPWDIAISRSANLIVISDCCNHKVHLYSLLPLRPASPPAMNALSASSLHSSAKGGEYGEIRYRKIKEIGSGRERAENGQFSSPRGVGIHGKGKFFVVADEGNVRLQFFSLSGDFLCSYNPLLLNGTPYFHRPFGISIDKKDYVIGVSDPSLAKILLFKSPIF